MRMMAGRGSAASLLALGLALLVATAQSQICDEHNDDPATGYTTGITTCPDATARQAFASTAVDSYGSHAAICGRCASGTCLSTDYSANNAFSFPFSLPLAETETAFAHGQPYGTPCANNASCSDVGSSFFRCECAAGYQGPVCQEDVDECSSAPCMNGGTCHESSSGGSSVAVDAFSCACVAGWQGDQCEHDVNECLSQPCEHGSCEDSSTASNGTEIDAYSCICSTGWTSENCTEDVNECVTTPCLNGAPCSDSLNNTATAANNVSIGTRFCNCTALPTGYGGPDCADVDDCLSNPCGDHGVCTDALDQFNCTCVTGWQHGTHPPSDPYCADDIDECASSPCVNGGACAESSVDATVAAGIYSCDCTPGWQGANCQSDVAECSSHPCLGNGLCNDNSSLVGADVYVCSCNVGWRGDNCAIDVNECDRCEAFTPPRVESNNALNMTAMNRSCNALLGGCAYNAARRCCSETIVGLMTRCHHDGTCLESADAVGVGINEFQCQCTGGYGGSTCDDDDDECSSTPCGVGNSCFESHNNTADCKCFGRTAEGCSEYYPDATCSLSASWTSDRSGSESGSWESADICVLLPDGSNCAAESLTAGCQYNAGVTVPNNCSWSVDADGHDICIVRPELDEPGCLALDSYRCECAAGYEGDNCAVNIQECISNPCVNGECSDGIDAYVCICEAGWEGNTCETELDYCHLGQDNCHEDAMCSTTGPGVFTCTCNNGYRGDGVDLCTDADECAEISWNWQLQKPWRSGGTPPTYYLRNAGFVLEFENSLDLERNVSSTDANRSVLEFEATATSAIDLLVNLYDATSGTWFCRPTFAEPGQGGQNCSEYRVQLSATPTQFSLDFNFVDANKRKNISKIKFTPFNASDNWETSQDVGWHSVDTVMSIGSFRQALQPQLSLLPGDAWPQPRWLIDAPAEVSYFVDNTTSAPCQQTGHACYDSSTNDTIAIAAFVCSCMRGRDGPACENDIDECTSNPCQYGANCRDSTDNNQTVTDVAVGMYNCSCSAGFAGENCAEDVDECASGPCGNGGLCSDSMTNPPRVYITAADNAGRPITAGGSCAGGSTVIFSLQLATATGFVSNSNDFSEADMSVTNCGDRAFEKVTPSTYTLQCNVNTGQAVSISVRENTFTNQYSLNNTASDTVNLAVVDTPTVTITAADQAGTPITNGGSSGGSSIVFDLVLSEASSDFSLDNVSVSNCTDPVFTATTASLYSLQCDGASDQSIAISVSVLANTFTNPFGVGNTESDTFSVIGVVGPTVSITAADQDGTPITNGGSSGGSSIVFTLVLSEASSDFSLDNVSVSNCTGPVLTELNDTRGGDSGSWAGSGFESSTMYALHCNSGFGISAEHAISVTVDAGAFTNQDAVGNIASDTYTVVSVAHPTVAITAADQAGTPITNGGSSGGSSIVFTLVLSEASSDFSLDNVSVSNCTGPVFTATTASLYSLQCDGERGQTIGVSLGASAFTGRGLRPSGEWATTGVGNAASGEFGVVLSGPSVTITTYAYRGVRPWASNSAFDEQNASLANGSYSGADRLEFMLWVSEPTSDFTEDDIIVSVCPNRQFTVKSAMLYALQCDPSPGQTISVTVVDNSFTNADGLGNIASDTYTIVNAQALTISISAVDHDGNDIEDGANTNASTVTFTLSLSEDSHNFDLSHVNAPHCNDPIFEAVWMSDGTISASEYTLSCTGRTGQAVRVSVDGGLITDEAGVTNQPSLPLGGFNVVTWAISGGGLVVPTSSYLCECAPGWEGDTCGIDIDECRSSPCQRGNCTDSTDNSTSGNDTRVPYDAYSCSCFPGWEAESFSPCDIDTDECLSNPCQNSGLCRESSTISNISTDSYNCSCAAGWAGENCSFDVDECISGPCQNGGTCSAILPVDADTYNCSCTTGWTGGNCTVDVNECSLVPCEMDGNCTESTTSANVSIGEYECSCVAGRVGDSCEIDVNECLSADLGCHNDGTCADSNNESSIGLAEVRCQCVDGWRGDVCTEGPYGAGVELVVTSTNSSFDIRQFSSALATVLEPFVQESKLNVSALFYVVTFKPYILNQSQTVVTLRFRSSGRTVATALADNALSATMVENATVTRQLLRVWEIQEHLPNNCTDNCTNGYCVGGIDGIAVCECESGWTGPNCDTDHNECAQSPCQNSAVCSDSTSPRGTGNSTNMTNGSDTTSEVAVGHFDCTCTPGWDGLTCESDINECTSSPCLNGGNCADSTSSSLVAVGWFNCTCATGWENVTCADDVDECLQENCHSAATCADSNNWQQYTNGSIAIGDFLCICPPGYEQTELCDQDIDECLSSPCQNDGHCSESGSNTVCDYFDFIFEECPAAWRPDRRPDADDFFCVCRNGWSGKHCEDAQGLYDPCHPSYHPPAGQSFHNCTENATCVTDYPAIYHSYNCSCAYGFIGDGDENCTDIDECASDPCSGSHTQACLESYTSANVSGGYFNCSCEPGYGGELCEQDINECESNPCQNVDRSSTRNGSCFASFTDPACNSTTLLSTSWSDCIMNMWESVGSYRCVCAAGFASTNCAEDLNECASSPCGNFGSCVESSAARYPCNYTTGALCSEHVLGDSYICECVTGWEGTDCEIDVNECAQGPCLNGADCIESAIDGTVPYGTYQCDCAVGFSGTNCAVDIDECAPSPCNRTNFVCKESNNDTTVAYGIYECECAEGYQGTNCLDDIQECDSNPCRHGSACLDLSDFGGVGLYNCTCTANGGWEGDNCNNDINECDRAEPPCQNGGSCNESSSDSSIAYDQFHCSCAAGWGGETCTDDVDECATNPCLFGGLCMDSIAGAVPIGEYECTCLSGRDGVNCAEDINECVPNPCNHNISHGTSWTLTNGTCSESNVDPTIRLASYECTCQTGFGGNNCAEDIDECASAPCRNGGACTDSRNTSTSVAVDAFSCSCAPGWEGGRCENNIDDCAPGPCLHNGTCIDHLLQYDCECQGGYFGDTCQLSRNPCGVHGFLATCGHANNTICSHTGPDLFRCDCEPGYTATNNSCDDTQAPEPVSGCDPLCVDVDECLSNPCANGGACNDSSTSNASSIAINAYNCSCAAGWAGENCVIDIDECSSSPCRNGANCTESNSTDSAAVGIDAF
eukprot:SAG22_NODE_471_length_10112_cov_14.774094_1_plen_3099_part_10